LGQKAGIDLNLPSPGQENIAPDFASQENFTPSEEFSMAWVDMSPDVGALFQKLALNHRTYYERGYSPLSKSPLLDREKAWERHAEEFNTCEREVLDRHEQVSRVFCTCEIPLRRKNYAADVECFSKLVPIHREWKEKNLEAVDLHISSLLDILGRKTNLSPSEITWFYDYICFLYYISFDQIADNDSILIDQLDWVNHSFEWLKEGLKICSEELKRRERENLADLFGNRPGEIVLKRVKGSNKDWHIWFLFGSLDLHEDDTAKLAFGFGGALSAKFQYNFSTHDYGSGIGVGLNLGKVLGPGGEAVFKHTSKFEFSATVDSKQGIRIGGEAGVSPSLGVMKGNADSMVIKFLN
jgi:hypothetical protein